MTPLTFYGGIGESGSNKILLEYMDTYIFIDFGQSRARALRASSKYLRIIRNSF